MKPIEKALILRKSARLRSREPMRLFRRRLREPERILGIIEGSEAPESSKQEARRQYLVAVCAAFESFWREFVRVSVDRHRVPRATLDALRGASFTIGELQSVLGRKLSLGELISCSYSFQGPDAVNSALSDILQFKVFSEFGSARFAVREVPRKKSPKGRLLLNTEIAGTDILKRTLPAMQKAYTIRHDTVHNTGASHRVAEREVWTIGNAAWELNTLLGMHLEGKFDQLWGRPRRSVQPEHRTHPTTAAR